MHELNQAFERVLNNISVQIQLGINLQVPTRQALPTGIIQARRPRPYFYYGAPPTTYGALTIGVAYRPPFINRHLGAADHCNSDHSWKLS